MSPPSCRMAKIGENEAPDLGTWVFFVMKCLGTKHL